MTQPPKWPPYDDIEESILSEPGFNPMPPTDGSRPRPVVLGQTLDTDTAPTASLLGRLHWSTRVSLGVTGVLVVALVVWVAGAMNRPPEPTWSDPIVVPHLSLHPVVISENIIAMGDSNGSSWYVSAMNLRSEKVLWTATGYGKIQHIQGDETGIVVQTTSADIVLDTYSGAKIGSWAMTTDPKGSPNKATNYWAGNGIVLTTCQKDECPSSGNICARAMASYGACLWTGRTSTYDRNPVFGGGRWVNTTMGVVLSVTGQLVSFGADAGSSTQGTVSYTGDVGRVFRVTVPVWTSSDTTFQPWDTDTDSSAGAAFRASSVQTSSASMTIIAYGDSYGNQGSSITAYSWPAGRQLWKLPGYYKQSSSGFIGDAFATVPDGGPLQVLNLNTGQVMHKFSGCHRWIAGNGILFTGSDPKNYSTLEDISWHAYDMSNNFKSLWLISRPSDLGKKSEMRLESTGAHVYSTTWLNSGGSVSVLKF